MKLLFLGDSITDCGHCFSEDGLGDGYVKMISQKLNDSHSSYDPGCGNSISGLRREEFHVVNGGTDGFTFPRIYQKWRQQYSSENWDIVSILGGVNEVGAIMDSGLSENAVSSLLASSEQALYMLLRRLCQKNVRRILLLEPFLFPYPAYLANWMLTLDRVRSMIRNAASMAEPAADSAAGPAPGFSASFRKICLVPLQPALDAYASEHGFSSVTTDGIHLTEQGHRIICDCILNKYSCLHCGHAMDERRC